jgi:hypothetical protein
VVMKSINFWNMTPCSPLSFNRRFGGTYRLHLQGRRNRFSKPASWTYFFGPEDGGDMFLRNVGWNSTDCTESYSRRWYSSKSPFLDLRTRPSYYCGTSARRVRTEGGSRRLRPACMTLPGIMAPPRKIICG